MIPAPSYFEFNAVKLQNARFPLGLGRIEPPHPGMTWQHEQPLVPRNIWHVRTEDEYLILGGVWTKGING